MPVRKTPSKGGKPDKLMRDALMLAIKREHVCESGQKTSKLNAIASKVVEKAIAGDMFATSLIRDTVDGRPAQAVQLANDPESGPLVVRWES